jgi:hypothetical protein
MDMPRQKVEVDGATGVIWHEKEAAICLRVDGSLRWHIDRHGALLSRAVKP